MWCSLFGKLPAQRTLSQRSCDRTASAFRCTAEPMHFSDSAGLTQDDIHLLNRRVEWVCE
jgi:hypothetical protein